MAAWNDYRVPMGVRLILPKRHAAYRSENAVVSLDSVYEYE